MADAVLRDEKVAAGLKKLRKFQQRAAKRKAPTTKDDKASTKAESERCNDSPESATFERVSNATGSPAESCPDTLASVALQQQPVASQALESESMRAAAVAAATESDASGGNGVTTGNASGGNGSSSRGSGGTEDCGNNSMSGSVHETASTVSIPSVTAENLRLLSAQLSQLIQEEPVQTASVEPDRGGFLKHLEDTMECLQRANSELNSQVQTLSAQLLKEREEHERDLLMQSERLSRDKGTLDEQLQMHRQTIGLLVGEKTELEASLAQAKQTVLAKNAQMDELESRLRSMQSTRSDTDDRVDVLLREKTALQERMTALETQCDRYKRDAEHFKGLVEEVNAANRELTNRLSHRKSESDALRSELATVKQQLSLAELVAKQLRSDENCNSTQQEVTDLHEEINGLKMALNQAKLEVEKVIAEKQRIMSHSETTTQELQRQVEAGRAQVSQLTSDKELIINECSLLKERLAEIEHELSEAKNAPSAADHAKETKIQQLEMQLEHLRAEYEKQNETNTLLSATITDQSQRIVSLEREIASLEENQMSAEKLVATAESDKVAASRALSQNIELKRQNEEFETAFVKLSNEKLKLTEDLEREIHASKELAERLGQQEKELNELRHVLATREQSASRESYQSNMLQDQLRHYQARAQLCEETEHELQRCRKQMQTLIEENTRLQKLVADTTIAAGASTVAPLAAQREENVAVTSGDSSATTVDSGQSAQLTAAAPIQKFDVGVQSSQQQHEGEESSGSSRRDDLVRSLSASVTQLELERDHLHRLLDEQRRTQPSPVHSQCSQVDETTRQALTLLEEQFKRTMQHLADVSDEKQQLEHLVEQLRGETDTIADYIALYQSQRSIMRRRAEEKDEYISRLAADREDLKSKLAELKLLVKELLAERDAIASAVQRNAACGSSEKEKKLKESTSCGTTACHDHFDHRHPSVKDGAGAGQSSDPNKPDAATEARLAQFPECRDACTVETGACGEGDHEFHYTPVDEMIQMQPTAKKIIRLLRELERKSTAPLLPDAENTFHPCSVCSGRLLNV